MEIPSISVKKGKGTIMGELLINIFNSNGFWTIVGIIIGSCINLAFWFLQNSKETKQKIQMTRQEKILEICDFCTNLIEKLKIIYGKALKDELVQFFSKMENFWGDTSILKNRVIVQIFFPDCLDKYDNIQLALTEYMNAINIIMRERQVHTKALKELFDKVLNSINDFTNTVTGKYFKSRETRNKKQ